MKKYILLLALVAVCFGCKKESVQEPDEPIILVDYGYHWFFYIDNRINKTIALTAPVPLVTDIDRTVTVFVEADKVEQVSFMGMFGGESKAKLEDNLPDDFQITRYGYPFTMTVGGEAVSDEIWLKKHWTFESDFYTRTYTLTLTDELLKEIGWEEVEL